MNLAPLRESVRGELRDDDSILATYNRDASRLKARPLGVFWPLDTTDVHSVVHWARERSIPLVPRGAGTGLAGGSVGQGLIVDTARLTQIEIQEDNLLAIVGAGVINTHLQDALKPYRLFWPPDPSSHRISSIGGNLATNAGGPSCLKYGVTRHWVLGVRAVLGTGKEIRTGSLSHKDVAGYDLTGLLVGSEGTLGILTEATLRLAPIPEARGTVVATFPSLEDAALAVQQVRQAGITPEAMEFMDGATLSAVDDAFSLGLQNVQALLLVGLSGHRLAVAQETQDVYRLLEKGSLRVDLGLEKNEIERLWLARRSAFGSLARRAGNLWVEDISVPLSSLATMVRKIDLIAQKHDLLVATLGHAGDGNLHPQFSLRGEPDEEDRIKEAIEEIVSLAVSLGGTLTGEHGVGQEKRDLLPSALDQGAYKTMEEIKKVFDPLGIMNPGKVL